MRLAFPKNNLPFWLKVGSRPPLLQRGGSGALWQLVLFASQVRRGHLPRKGWSTVQVPDGRLVATHPRSTSTIRKVADEGSAEVQREGSGNSSSRFSSWSASPWSSAWSTTRGGAFQCKGPRDQIGGSNGSSRRVRPTYAGLQDALKKAKAQAQVRPVADRIASSKVFIERAKKRILTGHEEVSRAQEALTSAQVKLQSEEQRLANAEARLASLLLEESNGIAAPLPTVPCRFRAGVGRVACLCPAVSEGSTPISVLNCNSKVKVAKNGKGNIQEICQVRHSIWHRYTTITVARRSARGRVRPYLKDCRVCPDGDIRQRRGQRAHEPFQPIVKLTTCRSLRAGARYGSSDVAMSNPAPRLPATQVDCDDELVLSQLAHDLANVPGPEVHVLSQGSSGSDTKSSSRTNSVAPGWTTRSAKASAPLVFHCTGKFASPATALVSVERASVVVCRGS